MDWCRDARLLDALFDALAETTGDPVVDADALAREERFGVCTRVWVSCLGWFNDLLSFRASNRDGFVGTRA